MCACCQVRWFARCRAQDTIANGQQAILICCNRLEQKACRPKHQSGLQCRAGQGTKQLARSGPPLGPLQSSMAANVAKNHRSAQGHHLPDQPGSAARSAW